MNEKKMNILLVLVMLTAALCVGISLGRIQGRRGYERFNEGVWVHLESKDGVLRVGSIENHTKYSVSFRDDDHSKDVAKPIY